VPEGELNIEAEDEVHPKVARDRKLPSAIDVACHECTHMPYRSWCKFCVQGRGRGEAHRQGHGSTVPIIGLDYFFLTESGVKRRKELRPEYELDAEGDAKLEEDRDKGIIVKAILIRCRNSKCLFAHGVPCKGADEQDYVANLVAEDVLWLGHTEIILKGDNEPALQAVITRVLEVLRVRVARDPSMHLTRLSSEKPPAYDSQSNGATEVGVMLIRGLFRTLKLSMEARLDKHVPIGHALIPWLLEHTALILNVKSRGEDGLTPWARVRGRPFSQQLLCFAESVLYKLPSKGPLSQPGGNMGAKWLDGVFIGFNRTNRTFRIVTDDELVDARSVSRLPEPNRWSSSTLARMKFTPWSRREARAPDV
jgi:hypothetical protein